MTHSNDNLVQINRHRLSTAFVSVSSAVLGLIAIAAGVAGIVVIEVNGWPTVSLLAAPGLWVLGTYYLVLASDLWEIHSVETSRVVEHVKPMLDEPVDAGPLAA